MNRTKSIKCYQDGVAFQNSGKLAEAERAYHKAIKSDKKFVEAYNNLGNVLLAQGQLRDAVVAFKKAQGLLPKHPMLQHNLGNALQLQGELKLAIDWYRRAIAGDPEFIGNFINLGNALRDLGQFGDAEEPYRQAIKLAPEMADNRNNLGSLLIDLDKPEEAIEQFLKAIEIDPEHIEAFNGLGNAFKAMDQPEKAIPAYLRAVEINPRHKDAFNGLGNAYTDVACTESAIEAYQRAIDIDPNHVEALNGLGNAYSEQGGLEEATAAYRKAIEIDPKHKDARLGLGKVLSDFGEIEKAITALREALVVDSDNGDTYRCLTKNKHFSEFDDDIRKMESLFYSPDSSADRQMHLAFGLGKAYEDLAEYEKSMDFILQATKLKRETLDYSISETERFFARIKQVFSAEYMSDISGAGDPDATPIFILGMPRSGTSLAEQILASHPQVYGAGELSDLSKLADSIPSPEPSMEYPESAACQSVVDLAELGGKYIAAIRRYSSNAIFITDKMPHNFRYIGLIKAILPNARIVNCIRDPMDNCLSIFKNYFASTHNYSYDLTELGEYYRLYLDLMDYWKITLPGQIYDLNYETLVADAEKQVRLLLDYCHLPWDDACLNFYSTRRKVRTASNAQVRRPIYKDSVALWKRYENQLEPLKRAIYSD
ncbi:MAG: tetratricopeptide repeat protein [Gammaproteobacteria bacterium]|nr:tetratricopeptide repeat protein [Gammaproteobacteria bacterium]